MIFVINEINGSGLDLGLDDELETRMANSNIERLLEERKELLYISLQMEQLNVF